jgi:glycosyltransferase involved in cell wall biosynthesis
MSASETAGTSVVGSPSRNAEPVSLVLITRNAGAQLAACIDSAPFASEVVVVDSGSVDDTVPVAESRGARVVQQPFLGFGRQKQFAVERAANDWVLCLDADERLSPELAQAIRHALAQPAHVAYAFARCNRFLGRWLRHGEGYPDWTVRLFDRRSARWSDDAVHEKVVPKGTVGRLSGDLLHDSAESLERYLEKQNRYTSLQAEAMERQGETTTLVRLLLSPAARFVRFYVLRAGFLDGIPGLVHIAIGSFASFLKYAKLAAANGRRR